jgi:homogentisate 1,2-dioxygenase
MYLTGFGNHHATEAIAGALPVKQNSPQQLHFGLYAEQLNGSAFTQPRFLNLHSWLYRKIPSAAIHDFTAAIETYQKNFAVSQPPNALRWSPLSPPQQHQDFLQSLFHLNGCQQTHGYIYQCTTSMTRRYFNNRDGELLFIPYQGQIRLRTEMGILDIQPGMIAVIPRGIYFAVDIINEPAYGYLCENGHAPFTLPELGPLGANSLANPRHFLYPTAAFEDNIENVDIICKYQNHLWISKNNSSPLNVVAWHGNYAPYCYDLSLFNTMNTVSFDHPDPSIFTVLTSQSDTLGVANLDFVIFPPRWMVAEHTFRPPYFHRNIMNEWMGLIQGVYDAKQEGFLPGGNSIHNCMVAHGPDYATYLKATEALLKPTHYKNTLAFMLESRNPWLVTHEALQHCSRQTRYTDCWSGFRAPSKT